MYNEKGLFKLIYSGEERVRVAFNEDDLVGFIQERPGIIDKFNGIYIPWFYAAQKSQGIGTSLIKETINSAEDYVLLAVAKKNETC